MKFMNSMLGKYGRKSMAGTHYGMEEMISVEWLRCKNRLAAEARCFEGRFATLSGQPAKDTIS